MVLNQVSPCCVTLFHMPVGLDLELGFPMTEAKGELLCKGNCYVVRRNKGGY